MAEGRSSAGEDLGVLCATVALILKDDGFSLPSESARNALSLAEKYLVWSNDELNKQVCIKFARELQTSLNCSFPSSGSMKNKTEKMRENYYKLCSSTAFRQMWNDHLSPLCVEQNASPVFY